ncbi:unnamed protein product [Mycena citricolor]|uniref:Uncharacterized protein n=1 Tax=Mycena citricolor TaxID=2018698 RepID=A0AAD2H9E2_9AGAR|nr:unnamed protein product [Mycena citricolor]
MRFLRLSGDLMPVDFGAIHWPKLQSLTVSEHTASRQLLVPALTAVDDPIFSQLPESLNALHIHARCHPHYGADHADLAKPAVTALSNASAIGLVKRPSHLANLIEFTISGDEFPTAPLLETIASQFPNLIYLEASRANYQRRRDGLDFTGRETRNDTVLTAMPRFRRLETLKITLHVARLSLVSSLEQAETFDRLFGGIPSVETVHLPWFSKSPWVPGESSDSVAWLLTDREEMERSSSENKQPEPVEIILCMTQRDSPLGAACRPRKCRHERR